jgi:hypothetical protein
MCAGLLVLLSCAKNQETVILKMDYKGWKNAIALYNNQVRLVVVPEIGRIMHYGFVDDKNVLYENGRLEGLILREGEIFQEDGKPKTPNLGGDRVLPSSENYFHLVTGSRHLPDQYINTGPYSYTLVKNGVRIESPVSQLQGIKMVRTIQLEPDSTRVKIEQRLEKFRPAKDAGCDAIPLTIWSLSQIRAPQAAWLPLRKNSVFAKGFDIPVWPDNINYATHNYEIHDGILKLRPITENHQKIGADADGWVAGLVDNVLMVERFDYKSGATYPDGGTSVAIYSNADFTELECLSPEKILKCGESIEQTVWWELCRINSENDLQHMFEKSKSSK